MIKQIEAACFFQPPVYFQFTKTAVKAIASAAVMRAAGETRYLPEKAPAKFRCMRWVDYYDSNGFPALGESMQALAGWLRQYGSRA
jgi:hypothetical protein